MRNHKLSFLNPINTRAAAEQHKTLFVNVNAGLQLAAAIATATSIARDGPITIY